MTLFLILPMALGASVGPIVFQHDGAFLLMDRDGKPLRAIRSVGNLTPVDLAVTADGQTLVFTATASSASEVCLYRYGPSDENPVKLTEQPGFIAQPTITDDGRWIVFVHHQGRDGGPPGSHAARAYGQLWQIQMDGHRLKRITSSVGCKLKPDANTLGSVTFTHADCKTSASVERIGASIPGQIEGVRTNLARQNGAGHTAYIREYPGNYELVSCSRRACQVRASMPRDAVARELAWGASGNLFLQLGPSVFHVSATNEVAKHLDLNEALR